MPAHPRSRGENAIAPGGVLALTGSSPLTRGKPALDEVLDDDTRLIPAHAGKTNPARKLPDSWGAHPRSRGENAIVIDEAHCGAGSSPLTRGKHEVLAGGGDLLRLIPAHAGKTSSRIEASP